MALWKVGDSSPVKTGELIGYMCRFTDRSTCGIALPDPNKPSSNIDFEVNHVGVEVRFHSLKDYASNHKGTSYAPDDKEVMGVLAIPGCIYDQWVEDHLHPTPKDPSSGTLKWLINWFAACPGG